MKDYEQVTTREWTQLLAKASPDLDLVYYFLRLNPFLCQTRSEYGRKPDIATGSKVKRRRRSKKKLLSSTTAPGAALKAALDDPAREQSATALTQAVAAIIDNVVNTMEVELQYQDRLEREVEMLRQEIAILKRHKQPQPSGKGKTVGGDMVGG